MSAIGLAACTTNKTAAVGGGCSSDDACATKTCFSATDQSGEPTGWSGGYCSGDCSTTSCPQGKCQALADGKSYCLSSCSSDGDCRSGYVCDKSLSVCLPDCRKNWSCGSTLTCNQSSGNCEPPSKTIQVGGACIYDVSCTTGTCFPTTDSSGNATGWTDGYCSGDCASASCSQGKCQALADGKSYCLSSCSSDGDCRSGYVCDKSLSVCLPDCRKNWSCGSTLTCNQSSGNCEPPSKTIQVGGACIYDVSCTTGTCFPATDSSGNATGWTDGYCSGDCASASCPQGECQALADGKSYCLSSCSSDGDCRSGYVCDKSLSVCLPDCRKNWSCGSTLTCNQSGGNCEPPSKTIQVGGACIYNVSCTTGTCFPATDSSGNATGWTDGYCSGDCASASCPQGECQALADGKSYCLSSCSSDGDCRSGYVCDKSLSVCLPDCRKNWSCGSTLTCNQSSGNCE